MSMVTMVTEGTLYPYQIVYEYGNHSNGGNPISIPNCVEYGNHGNGGNPISIPR